VALSHPLLVPLLLTLLLLLLLPLPLPHLLLMLLLQPKWSKVKGLTESLGDGHVVSNMAFKTAPLTYKALQGLTEGHAVFTMPSGVIKCPGAGQKACYISEGKR
jgi:sulfide:quinone oxidoreductase